MDCKTRMKVFSVTGGGGREVEFKEAASEGDDSGDGIDRVTVTSKPSSLQIAW